MKVFITSIALSLLPIIAYAQDTAQTTSLSIKSSIETDVNAALTALNTDDFANATSLLRAATLNATRLSTRTIAEKISLSAPSFQVENSRFALANSSTLQFDNIIKESQAFERRFKDNKGRVVTIRVFGEDTDLDDFMFIANDTAMLDKGKIELAEMNGSQALKNKQKDGSLSVLMMSEKDHALIEIQGEDESSVMAFIAELEGTN